MQKDLSPRKEVIDRTNPGVLIKALKLVSENLKVEELAPEELEQMEYYLEAIFRKISENKPKGLKKFRARQA